mmetsp:Transcript_94412/g.299671  ORF Transcript_94412/g.299671 Transcript_94412/m.299671 type:complete len:240 (+) Transcript_94412:786-1505(+)
MTSAPGGSSPPTSSWARGGRNPSGCTSSCRAPASTGGPCTPSAIPMQAWTPHAQPTLMQRRRRRLRRTSSFTRRMPRSGRSSRSSWRASTRRMPTRTPLTTRRTALRQGPRTRLQSWRPRLHQRTRTRTARQMSNARASSTGPPATAASIFTAAQRATPSIASGPCPRARSCEHSRSRRPRAGPSCPGATALGSVSSTARRRPETPRRTTRLSTSAACLSRTFGQWCVPIHPCLWCGDG